MSNQQEFTTRPQVVEYLVAKGMSPAFAKVAVDQQYNYDDINETGEPLRNGPPGEEDYPDPVTETAEQVDRVQATWKDMLTIEGEFICVDGEPMYDLNGNML